MAGTGYERPQLTHCSYPAFTKLGAIQSPRPGQPACTQPYADQVVCTLAVIRVTG